MLWFGRSEVQNWSLGLKSRCQHTCVPFGRSKGKSLFPLLSWLPGAACVPWLMCDLLFHLQRWQRSIFKSLWPLLLLTHLLLWLWPSFLPLMRRSCYSIEPICLIQHKHVKILDLITSIKSLLLCMITNYQVLGIRMVDIFLSTIILCTTDSCFYPELHDWNYFGAQNRFGQYKVFRIDSCVLVTYSIIFWVIF